MLSTKTHRTVTSLLMGVACLSAPLWAASPVKLAGAITGMVSDSLGAPRMGATVLLLNRQDRIFDKAITDERGEFKFLGLFPDLYSIKVTLATFVPALRRNIAVRAGLESVLNVNLNNLFSTIQITYPAIENGNLMKDDWKWILRGAAATRPVLRFADPPPWEPPAKPGHSERSAVFSDMHGMLTVSAGQGTLAGAVGNQAELGTAFALAASFRGSSQVQVSGNVGGSQSGLPAAAFRTSYSHALAGGTPEVSVTMRQLYLPGRASAAITGNDSALPMLRTMSASVDDRAQISDSASVQYGFTLDSVSFLDHLNYYSPYARVNYSLGDAGEMHFSFSSGNARPELGAGVSDDSDLERDLNTLGMFPNVSLRGGHAQVQRGNEFEVAYERKAGSRTFSLSAYHESVSNAALSLVAPVGAFISGDILPDLFSNSSIVNAGDYQSNGYTTGITQNFGDHLSATVMYGSTGALGMAGGNLESNSPDELRSMIRAGRRHAAVVRVSAISPWSGTRIVASYQMLADNRWAMVGNIYSMDTMRPLPGLNIYIRQPIPRIPMLPWRMEATADIRNLLAQDYLPFGMAGGQTALLVETPRSFRGGFNFIF